ncbi:hypothetical protein WKR88_24685 [Trinickia caryophylli]|uniref:hypothetical protein n=1 Tax=Trinickia caryophylli TaxID=28094 RepID=UPI001E46B86B|nr:hypothetical protein [Trinickia caryophylli]WQE14213.1 hypothetical protein U0034_26370 [Trinickia caryophylli]
MWLSNAQRRFLVRLVEYAVSDDAFLVALLIVPLLDFGQQRPIPDVDLRAVCGFDARRWTDAVNELVRLGALQRSRARLPARRVSAFRLGSQFRPRFVHEAREGRHDDALV